MHTLLTTLAGLTLGAAAITAICAPRFIPRPDDITTEDRTHAT